MNIMVKCMSLSDRKSDLSWIIEDNDMLHICYEYICYTYVHVTHIYVTCTYVTHMPRSTYFENLCSSSDSLTIILIGLIINSDDDDDAFRWNTWATR